MKFVLAIAALAASVDASYYSGINLPYSLPTQPYYYPTTSSFVRTPTFVRSPSVPVLSSQLAPTNPITSPWGFMMNNYVFPIRSSGEFDFAKRDGTVEKMTFNSDGINFHSNNPKMQNLLNAFKDVFMDPQGYKGMPMHSKASMVFIGMDGEEKEVTFGNDGFQLFSNNDDLNKIFAEVTAYVMNAYAAYAPNVVQAQVTGTGYY